MRHMRWLWAIGVLMAACSKKNDSPAPLAAIQIDSVYEVGSNEALARFSISQEGATALTSCGVVFGTAPNPTLFDSVRTTPRASVGTVALRLTGLESSTRYYARAYASNAAGTAYCAQAAFVTDTTSLELHTDSATTTGINFRFYGTLTSLGDEAVDGLGIVAGPNANPTVGADGVFRGDVFTYTPGSPLPFHFRTVYQSTLLQIGSHYRAYAKLRSGRYLYANDVLIHDE